MSFRTDFLKLDKSIRIEQASLWLSPCDGLMLCSGSIAVCIYEVSNCAYTAVLPAPGMCVQYVPRVARVSADRLVESVDKETTINHLSICPSLFELMTFRGNFMHRKWLTLHIMV